ncbi:hypothetical protein C6N75_14920 [Streptomyces solincola]|uniref:Uncharacterized protein n=1 Tax=Streptomyces solincola TaxID=2100817 RepID=A0A2S9PVL4_9ACTN|nr:hypothetical protein [Streptomyces solincola]PRH78455.1 hypothetical protein C6N75_14920 [Streptomyces solincola]
MALTKYAVPPRNVRQLRRVRSVYATGALLALLVLMQTGRVPNERHAVLAAVLLLVFGVLLGWTLVQLRLHGRRGRCSTARRLTSSA